MYPPYSEKQIENKARISGFSKDRDSINDGGCETVLVLIPRPRIPSASYS